MSARRAAILEAVPLSALCSALWAQRWWLVAGAAVALAACRSDGSLAPDVSPHSPTPAASTPNGAGIGLPGSEIGPQHVWEDVTETWGCPRNERETDEECVAAIMEETGVTEEAKEYYGWTGVYLQGLEEMGAVDLGLVSPPGPLANPQFGYVLLNGVPPRIGVGVDLDSDLDAEQRRRHEEIEEMARVEVQEWQGSPEAGLAPFGDRSVFEVVERPASGGQQFVFQIPLQFSHCCGTGYRIRVAFDFLPEGVYGGHPQVLSFCREEYEGQGWGTATPAPLSLEPCPETRLDLKLDD